MTPNELAQMENHDINNDWGQDSSMGRTVIGWGDVTIAMSVALSGTAIFVIWIFAR